MHQLILLLIHAEQIIRNHPVTFRGVFCVPLTRPHGPQFDCTWFRIWPHGFKVTWRA